MVAGSADLATSLLGELLEPFGFARLGLEVIAQPSGGRDLLFPRDVQCEAVLAEQLLLGLPLMCAGDVCGRHSDQMGGRPGVGHRCGNPRRPEEVDLDRLGQRRVEGHGRSGVDDDVGLGQRGTAGLVETETVASDVT